MARQVWMLHLMMGKGIRKSAVIVLEGNQIIIPEWQDAELRLIQNRIVIKDLSGENQSVCRKGEVFVFYFIQTGLKAL